MMTVVVTGVVAIFALLFAAMAFVPLMMSGADEREGRPATPVSFERRLPQAA